VKEVASPSSISTGEIPENSVSNTDGRRAAETAMMMV